MINILWKVDFYILLPDVIFFSWVGDSRRGVAKCSLAAAAQVQSLAATIPAARGFFDQSHTELLYTAAGG